MVCQNECSNHGSCDQYSKQCLCEAFWMQDIIRFHFGDRESNCVMALFWTCVCCVSRLKSQKRPALTKSRRYRKSNRNRYTLLEDENDDTFTADRIELLANNVKELNARNAYLSVDDDSLSDTPMITRNGTKSHSMVSYLRERFALKD
ncbi:unnamed protein product [Medioppia subpectinata]|uniref:Uncharacterized protein n=1 Tax=Medioppia subpectinata TaxID=1979941 RepID=A0A7R9L6T0_9ACAR|nr:unnamed protein product [Medioppia subpectinata]CAG2116567.1 unnamed protein product [Medioppia subpectinata]